MKFDIAEWTEAVLKLRAAGATQVLCNHEGIPVNVMFGKQPATHAFGLGGIGPLDMVGPLDKPQNLQFEKQAGIAQEAMRAAQATISYAAPDPIDQQMQSIAEQQAAADAEDENLFRSAEV